MATPNETDPGVRVPGGHRALRIAVLCLIVAAILVLAVTGWLSGRRPASGQLATAGGMLSK